LAVDVGKVVGYLDKLAPQSLALPGDRVGLQLGSVSASVKKILVALDPDRETLDTAANLKVDMLVTHHPLFYKDVKSVRLDQPFGDLIARAIKNSLNIFCMHTNFDIIPQVVSYQLVKTLGYSPENADLIDIYGSENFLKLVYFVPAGYEDAIREAIALAGAGKLGDYSHCTFQVEGTGTFKPLEGSKPFIGRHGAIERVKEVRVETILPAGKRADVLNALRANHPYEEIAYDFYQLDRPGNSLGLGLIVNLDDGVTIDKLATTCRTKLSNPGIRYWAGSKSLYRRVAFCGGSGGSLIESAARMGADLLVAGDFRYHDMKLAQALDLALLDIGHDYSEQPGVEYLKEYIERIIIDNGYDLEVHLKTLTPRVWHYEKR